MNRLILVGNGFDLAHSLKTSYGNFIENFWKNELLPLSKNYLSKLENNIFCIQCNYVNQIIPQQITDYKSLIESLKNDNSFNINYHNRFFEKLMNPYSDKNWVDIENEYYQLLDKCSESNYSIEDLNKDFDVIKALFIDYLKRIDLNVSKTENIKRLIRQRFYLKDLVQSSQTKILNEIQKKISFSFEKMELNSNLSPESFSFQKKYFEYQNEADTELEIINFLKTKVDNLYTESSLEILNLLPEQTLFLNFNYTSTLNYYVNSHYDETINIHGELQNEENPIIFGFGDDVHEKYREFENLNDNRYLKNFKSIAYLQTDNYKKLLEFLDLDEYQVFIFGHSCGISDRTMLNTIFEHDNCKSIKPFYHRKKDNEGNYINDSNGNFIDNYIELVQNISRNFNNKKKFRDKVVNKTYCEPLT